MQEIMAKNTVGLSRLYYIFTLRQFSGYFVIFVFIPSILHIRQIQYNYQYVVSVGSG